MRATDVGEAAARTGWSARMLRYLERTGLVVPERTANGYRRYGLRELNQLRSLREVRRRFGVELGGWRSPSPAPARAGLRAAVETWLHGTGRDALDWEQRKHERLLVA